MPNYCSNQATIHHSDPLVILKITKAFHRGEFLQTVVPMPDELKDTASPQDTPNWYDWRNEHWGTKWDIGSDGSLDEISPTEIIIYFPSAWSPPVEAYSKMFELGFEVEASYHEYGCMFYGKFANGVDTCLGYDSFDEIPDSIVDDFGIEEWVVEDEDETVIA